MGRSCFPASLETVAGNRENKGEGSFAGDGSCSHWAPAIHRGMQHPRTQAHVLPWQHRQQSSRILVLRRKKPELRESAQLIHGHTACPWRKAESSWGLWGLQSVSFSARLFVTTLRTGLERVTWGEQKGSMGGLEFKRLLTPHQSWDLEHTLLRTQSPL